MVTLFLSKGQVWKRVWILEVWSENGSGKYILWSEIGSRFGETGGTLQSLIPRSTPREYQPRKTQVLWKNLWKKVTVCYRGRLSQLERSSLA